MLSNTNSAPDGRKKEQTVRGRKLSTIESGTRFGFELESGLDPARQTRGRSRLSRLLLAGAVMLQLAGLETQSLANVIQANRTYPPPNGSFRTTNPSAVAYDFSPSSLMQLTNVAFTFFDTFAPDPPGPAGLTLSFNAQCSYYISMDGGVTFSGEQAATANFTVTLGTPAGNDYPFQITALVISGGDLPTTFQLRIPAGGLPLSPVVTFTPNSPTAGLFSINNNFYLPLELSLDSGASFTPSALPAASFELAPLSYEELTHSPTLPPGDSQYYSPEEFHAKFAAGVIIRNPLHNGFLGHSCTNSGTQGLCPPPLPGITADEDFDSQMSFELDFGTPTQIGPIAASVRTRVHHLQDSAGMEIYQTSMLELNPDPTTLPVGMNFRINPDPTRPSLGMTTIRHTQITVRHVASSFALRLQMTLDDGITWQDADQFARMRMTIVPQTPPVLDPSGFTTPGGVPTITFATIGDYKYRIVYSDTVTAPMSAWQPLINDPDYPAPDGWSATSQGENMTITDPGAVGQPHRYYRLESTQ